MNRRIFLAALLLTQGCAPTEQSALALDKQKEIATVKRGCDQLTSEDKKPHTAAVNCLFAGYQSVLKDAGFTDINPLNKLYAHYLEIAKLQDANKISDEKAEQLSYNANQEFFDSLRRRDNARMQYYVGAMQAIATGFAQGVASAPQINIPTYSPTPNYQVSMPSANAPVDNTLMDSYLHSSPVNNGMGQGAKGWDGRRYIPAGPDPNPPAGSVLGE